jgi:hypothetical protein
LVLTTLMLLQDWGSVQTLDGEAHRHRKQTFMSALIRSSVELSAPNGPTAGRTNTTTRRSRRIQRVSS